MDDPNSTPDTGESTKRSRRGFAAMNPERQQAIARLGGVAAHKSGNAHEFNTEEARAAVRRKHELGAAKRQRQGPGQEG